MRSWTVAEQAAENDRWRSAMEKTDRRDTSRPKVLLTPTHVGWHVDVSFPGPPGCEWLSTGPSTGPAWRLTRRGALRWARRIVAWDERTRRPGVDVTVEVVGC